MSSDPSSTRTTTRNRLANTSLQRSTTSGSTWAPEQIESFRSGIVRIDIDHPDDLESVVLSDTTHCEWLGDLTSV
jgi:hypothetical protein